MVMTWIFSLNGAARHVQPTRRTRRTERPRTWPQIPPAKRETLRRQGSRIRSTAKTGGSPAPLGEVPMLSRTDSTNVSGAQAEPNREGLGPPVTAGRQADLRRLKPSDFSSFVPLAKLPVFRHLSAGRIAAGHFGAAVEGKNLRRAMSPPLELRATPWLLLSPRGPSQKEIKEMRRAGIEPASAPSCDSRRDIEEVTEGVYRTSSHRTHSDPFKPLGVSSSTRPSQSTGINRSVWGCVARGNWGIIGEPLPV